MVNVQRLKYSCIYQIHTGEYRSAFWGSYDLEPFLKISEIPPKSIFHIDCLYMGSILVIILFKFIIKARTNKSLILRLVSFTMIPSIANISPKLMKVFNISFSHLLSNTGQMSLLIRHC